MAFKMGDDVRSGGGQTRIYDSHGLAASGVVYAKPGAILDVFVYNSGTGVNYLQLFDSLTVPADATVPDILPLKVPPASHASFSINGGVIFSTGIAWACSTTLATKTVGAAELWVMIKVR